MFTECGSLSEARKVFDTLPNHTVYTYTAVISAHAKLGHVEEAVQLFKKMQQCENICPNAYTFVAIVKACGSIPDLMKGRLVHSFAVESFLESDMHLCNTLIDMYAKCNSLKDAFIIFDRIVHRSLVTWNSMIAGYAQHGHGDKAMHIFQCMLQNGEPPDKVTFIGALKASSVAQQSYALCRQLHTFIVEMGYDKDEFVQSSIIDGYGKCGDLVGAWKEFDCVQDKSILTIWNAMITGCCSQGCFEDGFHLFVIMQDSNIIPDVVTLMSILKACAGLDALDDGRIIHVFIVEHLYDVKSQLGNAILDMYAKCKSVFDAAKVFEILQKDVVTWTAMIGAYVSSGNDTLALQHFQHMQEHVEPNEITYTNVLKACFSLASIEDAKLIHSAAVSRGLETETLLGGALVDLYSKCGSIEDASNVFANSSKRTLVIWSSMFAGFAMNGHHGLAWKCFQDMQSDGFQPDCITVLCLLSACSQWGSIEEGLKNFESTFQGHFADSWMEHYTCLLDLLVKAGFPKEAKGLVKTMPSPSDSIAWMTFLHNCQIYGDAERAYKCFGHVGR
ncbi:hypothetical protein KP509_39G056300 [Ceratopteris richardii]|nr:hypothetical protein KP509_39G056300 [Ceratopteris richardii]